MQKLLFSMILIFFLLKPAICQEQKTGDSGMPITISNCKFTWGLLNYKGCYGAAENGSTVCIGHFQFQQSIDKDNMVSTTQIFTVKNGVIVPKLCDARIITEDW